MKSKQAKFEEIILSSIRKAKERILASSKEQFEQKMKTLPKNIMELDVDPYMFIFDAMADHPNSIDFVLTQYLVMIEENFLSPNRNARMLIKHFRAHLTHNSFKIIQILTKIKQPDLQFFHFFLEVHSSIVMQENILQNFRFTGYRWLASAFAFKKLDRPNHIKEITSGILRTQNRNLPTIEDEDRSVKKYIQKMLINMTIKIENKLTPNEEIKSKHGFCFMCSNPADYYCKDTKIPVCGSECKKAHINYISNNPAIDYQYSVHFRQQIEKMLIDNIKRGKNLALVIDYLCAIFLNSHYIPVCNLPHYELLTSPVIAERVWVLYTMHYLRKGEVFEHIFADCLNLSDGNNEFVRMNCADYFLKMVEKNNYTRMLDVYYSLDGEGFRRIIPILLNDFSPDRDIRFQIVTGLINLVYNNSNLYASRQEHNNRYLTYSSLLRAVNHQNNPIQTFQHHFPNNGLKQLVKFIIKNEQEIKREKICQIINTDHTYRVFLTQLLYGQNGNKLLISPLIDEILREIFYFLNIKVSDIIYRMLQILCEVLPLNHPLTDCADDLSLVFSQQNTSSGDCFFQFAYFIIMIVTEIHNNETKNKTVIGKEQFLKRVQSFDKVFEEKQKDYILRVYDRIINCPFTQNSRGILVYYPQQVVKSGDKLMPISLLLQNWEQFYQIMMLNHNQTGLLYRCCSLLISYPQICQPFFQLLLNKLDVVQNLEEEHLLPSIKTILQEEPNCIGSCWKPLFMKNPHTEDFFFSISELVYLSRSLSNTNFGCFTRYFCEAVELCNYKDYLKLIEFNYSIVEKCPQRFQILTKQILVIFPSSSALYYKLQLIKGLFELEVVSFGCSLLDLIPVNEINQALLTFTLISIFKGSWQKIENKNKELQENNKKQRVSFWYMLVNKICAISLNNPQLFLPFAQTLRAIPQCRQYFQMFNILYCIRMVPIEQWVDSKFDVKQFIVDEELTVELSKFVQYIPQMSVPILTQFIKKDNIKSISSNFKYFWKIGDVYLLLRDFLIEQSNPQDLNINCIINVLNHADYEKELINTQYCVQNYAQISTILGFSATALLFLGTQITVFLNILQRLFEYIVAQLQNISQMNGKKLITIAKLLSNYLHTLQLLVEHEKVRKKACQLISDLGQVRKLLHHFNQNFQKRLQIMNEKDIIENQKQELSEAEGNNEEQKNFVLWNFPPALLQQQKILNILSCCYYQLEILNQILKENLQIFTTFFATKRSNKKNNKKDSSSQNWQSTMIEKNVKNFYQTLIEVVKVLKKQKPSKKFKLNNNLCIELFHQGFNFYNPHEGSMCLQSEACPLYEICKLLS